MANTVTILLEELLRQEIPLQRPAQPPVTTYCTIFTLPGTVTSGKADLPVIDSTQAVISNPSTFENSGDVISLGQAQLTHYSSQFGLTNPEQNVGLELRLLLASHLTNIEKSVQAAVNGMISTTNFSSVVTATSAVWAVANFETLRASVPGASIVALSPDYFCKTKNNWVATGEETLVKEFSNLSGLGANVVGFCAQSQALALIVGWPQPGPRGEVTSSKITLPIGIDVLFSRWFSRGGRQFRGSLDVVIGVEVGQPGAMKLIKSA